MHSIRFAFVILCAAASLSAVSPLGRSLIALRKNEPKALEDIQPGSAVSNLVMDPGSYANADWRQSMMMGEWLFRADMLRQRSGIASDGNKALERSWMYFNKTFQLIKKEDVSVNNAGRSTNIARIPTDNSGISDLQIEMLHMMALDVSTRLEASEKMKLALSEFQSRVNTNSRSNPEPRALYLAMRAALHCGDWTTCLKMVERLGDPNLKAQLHAQAGINPAMADYSVVLDWIAEKKPQVFTSTLPQNASGVIKSLKTREANGGWEPDGLQGSVLYRVGVIAHARKKTPEPMVFSGAVLADRLILWADRESGAGRHSERFEFSAAGPGRWKGSLKISAPNSVQEREAELEIDLQP